ncbi:MAG: malto-oligosyltrehalose trehalohydrolase [Polyangiales bacterium]
MSDHTPYGLHLGATVVGVETRFSAFTSAQSCAVRLYEENGDERATFPLEPKGDGLFERTLPDAGHGTLYKFVLDGKAWPDPYARFLPQGVHGPAMVVEPRHAFRAPQVARPLSEQVIYELHVGTFTDAGTYEGALAKLPELVKLGITTVELLPVAAFQGARGWGYDGVALFAPHAAYGTPDQLRAFVDGAHELGLSVLLDVVYNHFGPAGNYLSVYHPAYFTKEVQNPWGDAPNYAHPAMRGLALDNARYWLTSFGFDGLRLDAVHAIADRSERHLLSELAADAHALEPPRVLIAEDDRNDPAIIRGNGLDALWTDDFHHQIRVTLTGESDGYYGGYQGGIEGIARAIERGWLYEGQHPPGSDKPRGKPSGDLPAQSFVYCIQNHDQIGNRALGERLSDDVGIDAFCMASTILLFLPMTPLLFMGQEWAATSPFQFFTDHDPELGALVSKGRRDEFKLFRAFSDPDARARIPDPQAAETFARSRLKWEEREAEPHARVLALYTALISLRRTDAVLRDAERKHMEADVTSGLLRVRRRAEGEERVLLANFSDRPVPLEDVDLPAERTLLVASAPLGEEEIMPAKSAAIFGTRGVGVSS